MKTVHVLDAVERRWRNFRPFGLTGYFDVPFVEINDANTFVDEIELPSPWARDDPRGSMF